MAVTSIGVLRAGAFAILLISAIAAVTPLTTSFGGFDHDGQHYALLFHPDLNRDNEVAMTAPFCWRPGAPFIASRLPFPAIKSFKITGLVFQFITLVLVFIVTRSAALPAAAAHIAQLIYAGLFYTVKFTVYSPCYIDWSMMPFLAGILLCLYTRRLTPAVCLLVAGVVFKETVVFVLPAVAVTAVRAEGKVRGGRRLLIATLAVVFVSAAIRFRIRPIVPFSPVASLGYTLRTVATLRFWSRFPLEILAGLGALPIVLLHPTARRFFKKAYVFNPVWIFAGLIVPFCGSDKSRLFLLAALPMTVIAGAVLHETFRRGGTSTAWAVGSIVLHGFFGHQFEPISSFKAYLLHMVPLHSKAPLDVRCAVALVLAAVWILLTVWMFYLRNPASRRQTIA